MEEKVNVLLRKKAPKDVGQALGLTILEDIKVLAGCKPAPRQL